MAAEEEPRAEAGAGKGPERRHPGKGQPGRKRREDSPPGRSEEPPRERGDRSGGRPAGRGQGSPAPWPQAQARPVRPPRRAPAGRAPAGGKRPELPADLEPDLPRSVIRELQRSAKDPVAVAQALTLAFEAMERDDPEAAVPYLEWAKSTAPRSPSVREALGVARYLAGDWSGALREMQAYRRFTGRNDQNHLIADCLRGLGRPPAKVAELVREMEVARDGAERVAEGAIVWASALADHGHPGAGRAVLRRYLQALPTAGSPEPYELRMWYVAGDLAERDGDTREAAEWFRRLAGVDPDAYDVAERLAALDS